MYVMLDISLSTGRTSSFYRRNERFASHPQGCYVGIMRGVVELFIHTWWQGIKRQKREKKKKRKEKSQIGEKKGKRGSIGRAWLAVSEANVHSKIARLGSGLLMQCKMHY